MKSIFVKHLFFQMLCLLAFSACVYSGERSRLSVTTYVHSLGETDISLRLTRFAEGNNVVFVRLHDNEITAGEAAQLLLKEKGGWLIELDNNGERIVRFRLQGQSYSFDPNRIFTAEGRKATLTLFRNYSKLAEDELEKFAGFILEKIPAGLPVLAVHNNSNRKYSITRYQQDPLQKNALEVYRNPVMDEDDFVFTTSRKIFEELKERNISAVLQDNASAYDDGSLSVHYGRMGGSYANVEAEMGHLTEQAGMIRAVLDILD